MPKFKSNIIIQDTPSLPSHAARLKDVYDAIASYQKAPVLLATTGAPAESSLLLANFSNNNLSGYLPLSIDGEEINETTTLGTRILFKNAGDEKYNGIYVLTHVDNAEYVFSRASDFDEDSEVKSGVKIQVTGGQTNAGKTFAVVGSDPVINVDDIKFEEVATGGGGAGVKEKIETINGNGIDTDFEIVHDFDTKNVNVEVVDKTTNEVVYTDLFFDQNKIIVTFGLPPDPTENFTIIIRTFVS